MARTGMDEDFDAVLAAAQAGAEWAFTVLYRHFNPRLLRYFWARAPRHADDLAAETWLGAARQLARFEGGETDFRAWLFTIGHRRLVEQWRRAKRRPEALVETVPEVAGDAEDEAVAALSVRGAVRAIAALLSPDQAEVVLLRVLGGLSVEQVAELTGRRPGAVRVMQHRALRRLADRNFSLEGVTR